MSSLTFGYNAGLPKGVRAAWGARLIVDQGGYVDFVWNRQDAFGESDMVRAWLDGGVLRQAFDRLSEMLKSYEVQTRKAAEVVLYEDERGRVVGNTNASAGYMYVAAWLFEDEVRDEAPETPSWSWPRWNEETKEWEEVAR